MSITKKAILFAFIIFALSSCDDPQNSEIQVMPRDLISANINAIIEKGESIMTDTLNTYSDIKDTGIYGAFVYISDYNMCPEGWDGETPFYERIDDIYWADDNIVRLYYDLQDDISPRAFRLTSKTGTTRSLALTSFIVGTAISVADIAIDAYQKQKELELDEERNRLLRANGNMLRNLNAMMYTQNKTIIESFQGVSSILNSVQSGQAELSAQITALETKLTNQINSINLNIDGFRTEMRHELTNINEKIDTIINGLHEVGRDISLLHADLSQDLEWISNYLLTNNLNSTMNSIEGFLRDYHDSATWEQAQTLASDYITYYEKLFLDFLSAAKDMQSYALSENKYGPTVLSDIQTNGNGSFITFYRARVAGSYYNTLSHQRENFNEDYNFDYANPRIELEISYGNLEYLYKVIMTRFILHSILYAGEDLINTDSSKATRYLTDISDIREAAKTASLQMDAEYNRHSELISNEFSGIFDNHSTRSDVIVNSFSYQKYSYLTNNWAICTPEETEIISDLVKESFTENYFEYLGMYMSELFSLEVDLRSYINE